MELVVRNESNRNTVTVDIEEMEGWLNLSVDEHASIEEREANVQSVFEKEFNKPEYNVWHRENRHRFNEKQIYDDDEEELALRTLEDKEDTSYTRFIAEREEYIVVCDFIRSAFPKKEDVAEAAIAVWIDDETIRSYAERTGQNENNVARKLNRAKKKLKNLIFQNGIFLPLPRLQHRG